MKQPNRISQSRTLWARATAGLLCALGLACCTTFASPEKRAMESSMPEQALGWQLGSQCYTFNKDTYLDTLQRIHELGLQVIEIYPGQKFSAEQDFVTNHAMTPAQCKLVLEAAQRLGLKPISYGVVIGKDEADWQAIFKFAQAMKLQFVNCEPAEAQIPLLDRLSRESGVKIALHNHPQPSHYWNPEIVLNAARQSSEPNRWFACGDTGHWVRSGLDPVACLAKLQGHLGLLHFKDLNTRAATAHDVPWGMGVNDVWAELLELQRQQWRGAMLLEYEAWPEDRINEMAQAVDFLRLACRALSPDGWQPLFDADLANAQLKPGGWTFTDGVLKSEKKGDIWTKAMYGDFILDLEFKCAANSNSGVFLRTSSVQDWLNTAIEVQILQPGEAEARHHTGAIYDVQAPTADRGRPAGEWNHYTIIARGSHIYVMLNGGQVNAIDLARWTQPGLNPDGSKNKFKYAYATLARQGVIGLQEHGSPIEYRNLRIKPLSD
jgi:sugar phosphate isomerase/epimerase